MATRLIDVEVLPQIDAKSRAWFPIANFGTISDYNQIPIPLMPGQYIMYFGSIEVGIQYPGSTFFSVVASMCYWSHNSAIEQIPYAKTMAGVLSTNQQTIGARVKLEYFSVDVVRMPPGNYFIGPCIRTAYLEGGDVGAHSYNSNGRVKMWLQVTSDAQIR